MSDSTFPSPYPLSISASTLTGGATIDVLVIGSGYGGAIAAYRMAAAGKKVWVFERGLEILPRAWGSQVSPAGYPDTLPLVQKNLQIDTETQHYGSRSSLYDLHLGQDVNVLVGCGLGGTSLINANVALEADPRVFKNGRWPAVFQDPTILDKFYGYAKTNLGSNSYPTPGANGYPPPLNKLDALEAAADAVGLPFSRPPINVTFQTGPNALGVQQQACVMCGDCVSGCNYGAKNTTLMNYLPAAKKAGATLYTQAAVKRIEPSGTGWLVSLDDISGMTSRPLQVTASVVVLAAGTLGSTEILLRSADKVPMSKQIGSNFSANGDALAMGYDTDWGGTTAAPTLSSLLPGSDDRRPIYGIGAGSRLQPTTAAQVSSDPSLRPGPCITGLIDTRDPAAPLWKGIVIEEGVIPGAFAAVVPPLAFLADAHEGNFFEYSDTARRLQDAQELGNAVRNDTANIADYAYRGPVSRSQSYLVMSQDQAAGELALVGDRIRVQWPGAGSEPNFVRDDSLLRDVNGALRGNFLPDPLWDKHMGRQIVTVHPLGGCPMADKAEDGVVNDKGQVFSGETGSTPYLNLYVCDGSIVPSALGVNPLLTISALAERIASLMVVDHPADADDAAGSVPALTATAPEAVQPPAPTAAASFGWITPDMIVTQLQQMTGPELDLASRSEALAAIVELEKEGGPVGAPLRGMLLQQMTLGANQMTKADLKATIFEPLAQSAVAFFNDQSDPALEDAFAEQCQKLLARVPHTFSPGFSFQERMAGYVSAEPLPHESASRNSVANPFEVASRYGEAEGAAAYLVLELTISTNDLGALASDPEHQAAVSGNMRFGPLGPMPLSWPVTGKLMLLKTDVDRVETWQMIYVLSAATVKIDGVKILHRLPGSDPWTDLTTLYVTMTETGKPVRRGIVRLGLQDVVAQAYSVNMTPSKAVSGSELGALLEPTLELYYAGQFASFFSEVVFRAYGGLLTDLSNFPAQDNVTRFHRILELPPPQVYPIRTAGGTEILLTRYSLNKTPLQPVLVAPGFMVQASSFALDTVKTSLAEYLVAQGYDVWLFDYSGSPAMAPPPKPFTLDDVAQYDWPAAVNFVCNVTGAAKVQVVAHCVGSLSFMMAMLRQDAALPPVGGGVPLINKIKSAVCAQLTVDVATDWLNYLKVDLDLNELLQKAGVKQLDMRSDPGMASQLINTSLWNVPVPAGEECTNPLCHRVFSVYGPSYAHAQLNQATHDALCEWFGIVYGEPLEQLSSIFKKGYAIDRDGNDTYMPNVANLAAIPLTFLAGELNQLFLPESSAITLEWLREKNPAAFTAGLYHRHVFSNYAHMDVFIGKNSWKEVFPIIAAFLLNPLADPEE